MIQDCLCLRIGFEERSYQKDIVIIEYQAKNKERVTIKLYTNQGIESDE